MYRGKLIYFKTNKH